jgi:hypothetical protein
MNDEMTPRIPPTPIEDLSPDAWRRVEARVLARLADQPQPSASHSILERLGRVRWTLCAAATVRHKPWTNCWRRWRHCRRRSCP